MTKDMTSGSPAKLIFGFAIPMFLGLLFQQFYSMVDTLIVGKFLGVNPLAGVGSTTSLNFMVLGFCMGVCNGFAIPVAQMFGAKEEHRLRRYVTNGAWLCIVFSIVMTLVVVAVCRPVLVLMQTPEEIFEYAYVYIVIVFWGIPCTFLYNILAAIIRSLGDSKTPVIFLAISSGINIVLDLVFVLVFGMGVEGQLLQRYWRRVSQESSACGICIESFRYFMPAGKNGDRSFLIWESSVISESPWDYSIQLQPSEHWCCRRL